LGIARMMVLMTRGHTGYACTLGLLLAACSVASPTPSTSAPGTSSSPTPEPISPAVAAAFPITSPAQPGPMAIGFGSAWIRFGNGEVGRVDLATGELMATYRVGSGEFGNLAIGEGSVWVTTFDEDTVSRIDPETNEVVAVFSMQDGDAPEGIIVLPGAVWVSNHHGGTLVRVAPDTYEVVATIRVAEPGSSGPHNFVIAADDLWTSVPNSNAVVRIDPTSNSLVATITANFDPRVMTDGDLAVYATDSVGHLKQIDTETNQVIRTLEPDVLPWAFGLDAWWAVDGRDLLRLHPVTFEPLESWRISTEVQVHGDIAFDDGSIWLLQRDPPALLRIVPTS